MHKEKNKSYFLTSDGQRINGRGASGQQLITAMENRDSVNSLWHISEGHGQPPCVAGEKIAFGTKIRLTHLTTGSNLHSHQLKSPLSNQQEVSGFGHDGEGDKGDDWIVFHKSTRSDEKYWKIGNDVFIKHVQTNMYLGSTDQARFTQRNCGRNCPVMDHCEVFAREERDTFGYWRTEQGIYLIK